MAPGEASPLQALLAVARNMIPDNVVLAAVNMNILGIITFSLFFGLALASLGEVADPFVQGIDVSPPLCLVAPLVLGQRAMFMYLNSFS